MVLGKLIDALEEVITVIIGLFYIILMLFVAFALYCAVTAGILSLVAALFFGGMDTLVFIDAPEPFTPIHAIFYFIGQSLSVLSFIIVIPAAILSPYISYKTMMYALNRI
jgi:hypothetical protein